MTCMDNVLYPRHADVRCTRCGAPVGAGDLLCPVCHTALGSLCGDCRVPLEFPWIQNPLRGTCNVCRTDPWRSNNRHLETP